MVKQSCSKHLFKTIRNLAVPPDYMVTVTPAGAEEKCDDCGKKASWAVNLY